MQGKQRETVGEKSQQKPNTWNEIKKQLSRKRELGSESSDTARDRKKSD